MIGGEAVEDIEVDLLLEGILRRYGYDFRDYARPGLRRRLDLFLTESDAVTYLDMAARILRDRAAFHHLLSCFSVSFTSLFRDPEVYRALRHQVIPLLRTWPTCKVWHAGCATGEEVYSFGILLREAGLLPRTTVYATDINESGLRTTAEGIYALNVLRQGTKAYHAAGGECALSDHYHAYYGAAVMAQDLRGAVTTARHNLAMDSSFGEMQVVFCRNVMIYFNDSLREHVLELLWESLCYGGFLCLGDSERLAFSSVADRFECLDDAARIYKKKVSP